MKKRTRMLQMQSNLLSWIVGSLMSWFTHAASFCLGSASVSLYMCAFPYLLILWSSITATPRALGEDFPNLFLSHSLKLWKNRSVQTPDVISDPRPPVPFCTSAVVSRTWHNSANYILKEHFWWSFVNSAPPQSVCLAFGNFRSDPESSSNLFALTFVKNKCQIVYCFMLFEVGGDRIIAMALPTVKLSYLCVCVCSCWHSPRLP